MVVTAGGPLPSSLSLRPDPAAVRSARRFVRDHCREHGYPADVCDTAMLLTSETVTNAFTHGRSEARIRIRAEAARLVIEVSDDNSRHPVPVAPDADALDGRGLTILGRLADAWGVRDDAYGKTVWFELRVP